MEQWFSTKEDRFRQDIKEEIFQNESVEMLEQVAQRGGGCSIPGSIQIQAWAGSEHPDLVEDVHIYFRRVGLDDF